MNPTGWNLADSLQAAHDSQETGDTRQVDAVLLRAAAAEMRGMLGQLDRLQSEVRRLQFATPEVQETRPYAVCPFCGYHTAPANMNCPHCGSGLSWWNTRDITPAAGP